MREIIEGGREGDDGHFLFEPKSGQCLRLSRFWVGLSKSCMLELVCV